MARILDKPYFFQVLFQDKKKKWCLVVWPMCHFANIPFTGVLGL